MREAIWVGSFISLILAGWFWQAARNNMRSANARFVTEEETRVAMGYVAWDPSTPGVVRTYLVISSAFAFIMMISASVGAWFAEAPAMAALLAIGAIGSLSNVLWKLLSFRMQ
ncbi:hypothetical protein [Methylobacterium sp. NFXW15]|uniref:hypothetical protein n=1 Tax=Methylobacterium sp. NFXW15 TaxID=2819512 RepID=UPI003CF9ABBF